MFPACDGLDEAFQLDREQVMFIVGSNGLVPTLLVAFFIFWRATNGSCAASDAQCSLGQARRAARMRLDRLTLELQLRLGRQVMPNAPWGGHMGQLGWG